MRYSTAVPRLLLVAAGTIAVRCWLVFAHRIDSDEPQHLHVLWAWTRGLVQYRDVFDNHLPLLHLLVAPLMALVPESSAVFTIMRLAIAPFAIGSAWLLYDAARPLFGAHAAGTAALLFSVMPPWLAKSVEFRNDTLWIFFWLAALALLVRRSPFLAGVAMSLSLLASIKAIPLLLAHVLAGFSERRSIDRKDALQFVAGFALPLAITAVAFTSMQALDDMIREAILFNAAAPVAAVRRIGGAVFFAFAASLFSVIKPRAQHLTLFAIWYALLLLCFWPILTPRDFLPLLPVAALAIATRLRTAVVVPVVAMTVISAIDMRVWRPHDPSRVQFVDAVVRTTKPGDYVYDLKGDAVFRRRPVRAIYEDVGRALTANGTLADTGPEDIARTRTCVAIRDSTHIPPRTRAYLNANFVDVGPLRVCRTAAKGGT